MFTEERAIEIAGNMHDDKSERRLLYCTCYLASRPVPPFVSTFAKVSTESLVPTSNCFRASISMSEFSRNLFFGSDRGLTACPGFIVVYPFHRAVLISMYCILEPLPRKCTKPARRNYAQQESNPCDRFLGPRLFVFLPAKEGVSAHHVSPCVPCVAMRRHVPRSG